MDDIEQEVIRTEDRGPGVIVRPPLLYIGALVVAIVIDMLIGQGFGGSFGFGGSVRPALGFVLLAAGIGMMAVAITRFGRAGTSIKTSEASEALVTDGIYRLSRNPIYLGLTANYLGIAILVDAPVALLLLVAVLLVMRFGVIAREERYLERKFGESYRDFKRRTGRWIGPL